RHQPGELAVAGFSRPHRDRSSRRDTERSGAAEARLCWMRRWFSSSQRLGKILVVLDRALVVAMPERVECAPVHLAPAPFQHQPGCQPKRETRAREHDRIADDTTQCIRLAAVNAFQVVSTHWFPSREWSA